ncbi:uncharacterized protein PAC_14552 [Phialocephala subalpina]|uniref:DUF6536 domain-containing protein n=1 Tax=Phialocephala subalpina TaxID=576137 RepID=A0A1L7XI05_9HELO|nr:uncharacterized protein PAC_14552 [Phialocephala subalpina]
MAVGWLTNMKNLVYLPKRRVLLFVVLFLSTWPLHFVWNSIIFSTRQNNLYSIFAVTPDFVSSNNFDDNLNNVDNSGGHSTFRGFDFFGYKGTRRNMSMGDPGYGSKFYTGRSVATEFKSSDFLSFAKGLYQESTNGSMKQLDSATCMKEYSATLLSNSRNLLVVVKTPVSFPANQTARNGSILSAWMCSSVNDSAAILMQEGDMSGPNNRFVSRGGLDLTYDTSKNRTYEVDYCLSETVPEKCQVLFSVYLMGIVLVCNICKFVAILLTTKAFTNPPLVVLGDAVASFLNDLDPTSEGICLTMGPNAELRNMWSAVGRGTWLTLLVLVLAALGFGIAMMYKGSQNLGLQSFSSLSFGSIDPSALVFLYGSTDDPTSDSGWLLLRMVMIANSPQIYFSLLYFLYNRSYTAMLGMVEWTNFALERKSFRVSNPVGIQRSTYWLQLPYLYSVPLLVGSGLVHWILSEAFFLVRIFFFDRAGQQTSPASLSTGINPSGNTLTVPGYSPKAILAAIIVSAIMFAVLVWNEFRAYKSAMPLVVNSSFVISAACHRPDDDADAAYTRVMWGAVSHPDGDLPEHCCITSHKLQPPIVGEHYE